jgi:hydrophobic/amphiphilic exporter-1 (mainly G- bacteria), HAE1 family
MTLAEFSVKRRITITMLTLIVALFGMLAFRDLGIDLFPEIEYPSISVVTAYSGVGSEEMETLVTRPIEEFVSSVSGVKEVYSISSEGLSTIFLKFDWGINLDSAANDVREKVSWVTDYLPKGSDKPMVLKFNIAQMPIQQYGVVGFSNTMELREYLESTVKPTLERVDGIAAVQLYGGREREIQVLIDPNKLRALGVPLNQIKQAIMASNLSIPGGHVEVQQKEYLIRTSGNLENLEELRGTVINITREGQAIHLRDIAEVRDSFKEIRGYERTNLAPCVILGIMKQSGQNTVKACDRVKEQIAKLEKHAPPGVKFHLIFDQGTMISNSISNTGEDGVMGGLIALLVVWFFLRAIRPTLAIALAIPLSIVTTFIGMALLGYTFNIMTLGGLTLAVGLLVDDAIVVIENTFRHLEQGKSRADAAIAGTNEVVMAVSASTFTTMAVFIPLSLAKSMAGKLARPMALVVCIALAASLFVAFTIVPAFAATLFRREQAGKASGEHSNWSKRLNERYAGLLVRALNSKKKVLGTAFGLLLLGIILTPILGTEFMPKQDVSMSILYITMPEGTILSETNHLVEQVEKIFLAREEVLSCVSQVGTTSNSKMAAAQGGEAGGVNKAMVFVRYKDKAERDKTADEVINEVRTLFPPLEGVHYRYEDVAGSLLGSGGSPVVVELYGPDIETLDQISNDMMSRFAKIDGLKDLTKSLKKSKPELHIAVDRDKASQMGLTVYQIGDGVQTAMLGSTVSFYHQKGKEYDIMVRFQDAYRNSIDALSNVTIQSPIGFALPLSQVTKLEKRYGPIAINRKNQSRVVMVGATNFGRDLGSVVKDVQTTMDSIKMPQGYFYIVTGSYESMQTSIKELSLAFLVAIALIYMIMAAQFESLSQPFVVMFTMPLAYIGVILGLLLTGKSISVSSLMGLIILMGIVVKNGIVMIDYINQLRLRGVEKTDAIIEGATVRLRPILMTSLTAIVGMLPMAFSTREGTEMSSPMATAVAFGLLVSTALTLFVLPSIYSMVEDIMPRIQNKLNTYLFGKEHGDDEDSSQPASQIGRLEV